MSIKRICLGFGFKPEESRHHFLLYLPARRDSGVTIFERFDWQDRAVRQTINICGKDKTKAELSREKWKLLEELEGCTDRV
ncbi:MAG: hypothetical protein DDT19_01690 [Syntrophomonadaceae bacterium]|nr:hypothetical protein [Bacillota bacterium]